MRALGIDVGARRIGVAVSDTGGALASPVDVVDRSSGDAAAWEEVARLAAEWEVEVVVVGLPRSLDGTEGVAAASARADAAAVATATGLPVEFIDERFTTVTASAALHRAGLSSKRQRSRIDAAAAAVLLQSWLDARKAARR